jgi:hypothetical protein
MASGGCALIHRPQEAFSKDEFQLPRIDSLVDVATNLELMSLQDCYSGYHQIWMKK